MSRTWSRRTFLRALGVTAASFPFLKMLENSAVHAQEGGIPLKFVGVYHPHGVAKELFGRQESETETEFSLTWTNCSLQPFDDAGNYGTSFKDRIVVVEGIDHLSNANGHDSAGTILTGSYVDGQKKVKNPSIDQFLAVEKGLGATTRLASVVLGVGSDATEAGACLSFGAGGAPLPKIIDPAQAFEAMFGGLVVGDDPAAREEAERRRREGQSVIDFVRGDINRLKPRLAAPEQQKLEQHLTSLREIEKRLEGIGVSAQCRVPTAPDASTFPKLKQYNGGEPYFDVITDLHIDLLAQALACDVTRFGTLFMNDLSYAGNPLSLPVDNHGAVAHTYKGSRLPHYGGADPGDPASWVPLGKFNHYSYGKVARLLQRLHEFGVLDSTLVYASSDMGDPAMHSTRDVPTLLAGGANGKLRTGRRIKLNNDCPPDRSLCAETEKTTFTNNHILVSIAQMFGVDIDSYGTQTETRHTQGALSELA